ncbi:MAG: hypothetical protein KME27_21195 [Lyngbya sp. HA4199-MV5]|nr:hypothetical protein [Lyngbya sp. HA4199-MV5]
MHWSVPAIDYSSSDRLGVRTHEACSKSQAAMQQSAFNFISRQIVPFPGF